MATKVKGYYGKGRDYGYTFVGADEVEARSVDHWPRATLVRSDESVFTESEIEAAIERRIDELPNTLDVADYQRIRDVLKYLNPA